MPKTIPYLLAFCFSVALFCSCNNSSTNEAAKNDSTAAKSDTTVPGVNRDTLPLASVDPQIVLQLNEATPFIRSINNLDTSLTEPSIVKAGKGKLWRMWLKLFKTCFNNQTIDPKKLVYFGVTNEMGLGTILSYDEKKNIYSPSFPMDTTKMTADERKLSFVYPTTEASCGDTSNTKVNLSFLVQCNLFNSVNTKLNALIGASKKVTVGINHWKANYMYPDAFKTVVSNSKDPFFQLYGQSLNDANNKFVVTLEIQVDDFSGTIETNAAIDAGLQAKLTSGITEATSTGSTDSLRFTLSSSRTVSVKSTGSFIVFGGVAGAQNFVKK